jgi:hypothetical protein
VGITLIPLPTPCSLLAPVTLATIMVLALVSYVPTMVHMARVNHSTIRSVSFDR